MARSNTLGCVNLSTMGLGEETIAARERRASAAVSLFSSWFCPYAQRAWVALEEAGVDYRWREIQPYRLRRMSQRNHRETEREGGRGEGGTQTRDREATVLWLTRQVDAGCVAQVLAGRSWGANQAPQVYRAEDCGIPRVCSV